VAKIEKVFSASQAAHKETLQRSTILDGQAEEKRAERDGLLQ
jgi:hypothetical protein